MNRKGELNMERDCFSPTFRHLRQRRGSTSSRARSRQATTPTAKP
jgi:hypothetical protein